MSERGRKGLIIVYRWKKKGAERERERKKGRRDKRGAAAEPFLLTFTSNDASFRFFRGMQRSVVSNPHVERGRETSSLHIKGDVTITRHYLHDVRASFALSRQPRVSIVSNPFKDIRLVDDDGRLCGEIFHKSHRSRVSTISKIPSSSHLPPRIPWRSIKKSGRGKFWFV